MNKHRIKELNYLVYSYDFYHTQSPSVAALNVIAELDPREINIGYKQAYEEYMSKSSELIRVQSNMDCDLENIESKVPESLENTLVEFDAEEALELSRIETEITDLALEKAIFVREMQRSLYKNARLSGSIILALSLGLGLSTLAYNNSSHYKDPINSETVFVFASSSFNGFLGGWALGNVLGPKYARRQARKLISYINDET